MHRVLAFLLAGLLAPATAAPVLVWTFANDLQGWTPTNWESTAVDAGGFVGRSRYDCQLLSPPLDIQAADYPELLVSMTTDTSGGGETFFRSDGQGLTDQRKARHAAVPSPSPRLYRIRLQGAPGWEGKVERIRFDPLNPAGANVRIDFLALMPKAGMTPANGSMEILRDGIPLGWKPAGDGATVARTGQGTALRLVPGSSWLLEEPIDVSLLGTYRIDGILRGDAGARLVPEVRFTDGEGRAEAPTPLAPLAITAAGAPFSATFDCPRLAWTATVRFAAEGGTVELDDVYLTHVAPGHIVDPGPPRPEWQATWIWHPEALELDDQTAHFRYELVLPDRPIRQARIQITADDGYALAVNGRELERQFDVPDGWRTPEVVDLAAALKPGPNRFEVEARDVASAQGLIAEGIVTFADGTELPIRTGRDWLAAREPAGPWIPARELGTPPCLPWRSLPAAELAAPVALRGTLAPLPERVESPDRLPVRLDLALLADCARPVFVQARLTDGERVLAEAWADRPAFAAGAKARGTTTLEWHLPVPYGTATDRAALSFRAVGGAFAEPVPTGAVGLRAPAGGAGFPQAECRTIDGLPRLFVNGVEIDPTQAFFIRPDRLQQRNARAGRIPILCLGLQDIGFTERGFDYTKVDSLLASYLGACPEAWVIANFTFDTRYQGFWIKAHPEARCRLEDGSDLIGDYHGSRRIVPSYASPVWRDAYTDALRRLIRHLQEGPFASRIIGFHPCSGITTEWFHWGAQSGELVDYSDAGRADFRRWLAAKYGTDQALRAAWHRPDVSLADAAIPTGERRRSPALGIFFDPLTQQDVIDYNRYQHEIVAATIAHFSHVIKEETGGRSLAGTYYGYVTHLPETPGFCQGSGHFNLRALLDCPDVDFLMAPLAYAWREPGHGGASMTATASHALNGKLWWHQEDLRTHWVQPARYGASATVRETADVFRRELARNLAQGTAIQWYDFSNGWIFGDERVAAEAGRLRELDARRNDGREWPLSTYLAVIVDEDQMGTFDPFRPPYALNLVYRQRDYLNRAGIPWKCYLFSDLRKHPELLAHRAFLFLNLFRLDDEQIRFLRGSVMADGRTVAFVGPAGMIGDRGVDAAATGRLLGLDMVRLPDDTKLAATFAADLPEPWRGLAGSEFRVSQAQPPLLAPRQAQGTLARFADREELAVVAETRADHRLFWSAVPGLLPEQLRALARFSGLPVLASGDDPLYFGHGFLALHAAIAGERTVHLPEPSAAEDLFTGRTWPAGTTEVQRPAARRRDAAAALHAVTPVRTRSDRCTSVPARHGTARPCPTTPGSAERRGPRDGSRSAPRSTPRASDRRPSRTTPDPHPAGTETRPC